MVVARRNGHFAWKCLRIGGPGTALRDEEDGDLIPTVFNFCLLYYYLGNESGGR